MLANDASFRVIYVSRLHAMPLAPKTHGFELLRVIQAAAGPGMTRIYLELVRSLLLVANVNRIGFDLTGSRKLLAVRMRARCLVECGQHSQDGQRLRRTGTPKLNRI